jgi:hypothetical protein
MQHDRSDFAAALDETLRYLASGEALDQVWQDPYWPKWASPWWRMALLWELGLAGQIPRAVVDVMVDALGRHYLPFFPVADGELPAGADPYRHVICHCAAGTIFQVLHAYGVDVDAKLPWMRGWFRRYQMADGGLNCDDRAYAKPDGKSSVVSTLPPLEAVLRCTRRPFANEDARFLDRGAAYLLAHRLVRRAGGDRGVIDPAWLQPCFPRFYHYDVLRGLSFVVEWADVRDKPLPHAAVSEALALLGRQHAGAGGVQIQRRAVSTAGRTLAPTAEGEWEFVDRSDSFPLLDLVSEVGQVSLQLSDELERARQRLGSLRRRGLITE